MDPTLEEWAGLLTLCQPCFLLPHQAMNIWVPCYTQWVFHVQTRIVVAQLTSALGHHQPKIETQNIFPESQLLWWGILTISLQESSCLTVNGCSWCGEPEQLEEGSLFRDLSALCGHFELLLLLSKTDSFRNKHNLLFNFFFVSAVHLFMLFID